jgi:hypothetical protein
MEQLMITALYSSGASSSAVAGIIVAGCLVLAVIRVLSDGKSRPVITRLCTFSFFFMIPLLILFAYIVVMWVARNLAA